MLPPSVENPRSTIVADQEVEGFENGDDKIISTMCCMQSTGGVTRGHWEHLSPQNLRMLIGI